MTVQYEVIKPYQSVYHGFPITLPVGTILELWIERGIYISRPIDGYCVPVKKWAVEAWRDYFRKIEVEAK